MNKIFGKLLLFGFVLSLTACDDFLDKDVLGRATDETYYDTQYKMQSALDAVYDVLQSDSYNDQEWRFGEACADDVWKKVCLLKWDNLSTSASTPQTHGYCSAGM